jgi:hypothetical protein
MHFIRQDLFSVLVAINEMAWAGDISDLNKTPGAVLLGLTKEHICSIKWGQDQ